MDAIQHWAASWLFAPPGRGYFVILGEYTAYSDESEVRPPSFAAAVAGHLATPKEWAAFEAEWEGALAHYGLRCFHMVDFAHSRDEFEIGWKDDEPKRRELLARLLEIIERRTRFSFGVSMLTRDYEHANAAYPLHETGRTPYVLCGLSVVEFVDEWKKANLESDAVVKFIFDAGAKGKGQLITDAIALGYARLVAFEAKCPEHESPVGALQAACLDAYEHGNFLGDLERWLQSATEQYDVKGLNEQIRFPFKEIIRRTRGQGIRIGTVNLPSIERLCGRLDVKRRDEV